ncbi:MAG: DUF4432 family protein [Bacillota bacterium]
MQLGERRWSAAEVEKRIGRWQQIAGARAARLMDGTAAGVRVIDLYTERLRLTVYPDRGMDLGPLHWRGLPLTWESPTGPVHPALVDPVGTGWGRGFHGGLAATCGLENVGPACEDEGRRFGQHGTLSYTPASAVRWRERPVAGGIRAEAVGEVLTPDGLRFTREVWVETGKPSVWLRDRVQNPGPRPVPWMIQYHMNFGFPLVSEGAELLIPPGAPVPRDEQAVPGLANWNQVEEPQEGYREQVFRHQQKPDRRGFARCALVNEGMELGVVLRYPVQELPYLWQWRVFAPNRYVVALEPSNCAVKPRARARAEGLLPLVQPGETVTMQLELTVVEGREQLRRLRATLASNETASPI